ncbi:hypothetical protein N7488_000728 [Penicillium malachiteum]|nr:hypothetical protein N7488_000728 [Penicillium malachiteum]
MSSVASSRRAEHMGSLLRPAEFLDTLKKEKDPKIREELENCEIDIIVKDQLNLGFRVVNDGEYRRTFFWGSFFESLSGFEEVPMIEANLRTYLPKVTALLAYHIPTTVVCTSKIAHKGDSPHLKEFLYLKSIVPADRIGDIKITIPPPHWYHLRYKNGQAYQDGVYASDEEYFQDLAAAYRTELQILYDAGLRRVQLDDPDLSYFCSNDVIEAWHLDKTNTQSTTELLTSYIQLYNECLKDVKADMHIGIHTFYLEFDTPRAGGFEPLQSLPLTKNVVLGVVSTKSPQLEDISELKERVHHAAEFIAKGNNISPEQAFQRLGVSPQCGFASNSTENRLTKHNMLDKLNLVRELANSIWPGEA